MYVNGIGWFQYKSLTSSCLIVFLAQFILIVDSVKPDIASTHRQMCSKLQSMLSYGKYQTSQISSNITYASRIYDQNFLTYSSMDDLLIFIEPKYQIHVYNARTVQHIVNISTTDVVIATSCISLVSDSPHDLYFIYENNSETNLIFLRVCQVHFNIYKLTFDHNYCIETLKIQYDQPNLRIYGFTIKRDHAETKKSLLFISTEIGLIYTIFDTRTGSLINVPLILNETLNEGSVVLSPLGSIYYASNQEHLIYELLITRDFRLRYGNITKTNAIKSPFGLITDECNHLYIATRSMILIIYVQNSATIRSVFAKSSDLPITLERLNTTTYVYATIKKNTAKIPPDWMFNFLYFTQPEKILPATRHPVVNLEENLDFNITPDDSASIPILLPLSYSLLSMTNTSKIYTQFVSTPRKPFARFRKNNLKYPQTTVSIDRERTSTDKYTLFTQQPPIQILTPDIPDDLQQTDLDYDFENTDDSQFDFQEQGNQSLDQEIQPETYLTEDTASDPYSSSQNLSVTVKPLPHLQNDPNGSDKLTLSQESQLTTSSIRQSSDSYFNSTYMNSTVNPQQTLLSHIHPSYNFNTTENLTYDAYQQLHDYLVKQPLLAWNSPNRTTYAEETIFSVDDLQSYLQGRGNLSKNQERQIQTYLAKQSSSDQNIFSQFFTSTNKPNKILLPDGNIQPDLQIEGDHTIAEDTQLDDYSEELLPSDLNYFNHTIDSEAMLFTVDDLRSYVEGRGNLTNSQKAHIQAYLDRQSSSNQTLFSKYSKSTKTPRRKYTSDDNILRDKDRKDPKLEEFLQKIPLTDSKYFNFSTNSEEILIPIDDLRSYLQGSGNLSKSQEAQIQAYLSKQSSSDQNMFSNFLTTTKIPRTSSIPGKNIETQFERQGNHSIIDDTQPEYYSEEVLPDDFEYYNRTTDSEERLFTVDDVRSYLQGRANLSRTQVAQIQAYLARQSSSNRTIFSKYTKSQAKTTLLPTGTYTSDGHMLHDYQSEDLKLEELLKSIPQIDSKYFNFSTDSEEILIPMNDLRSYLQGRGNLSKSQEAQIQAYLSKQSSSDQNIFSKYLTSTRKPSKPSMDRNNTQYLFQIEGILSHTESTQLEDYSKELLLSDLENFNHTTDSEKILFSVDDLRSYLEGRGNLSNNETTQIQTYLARQASLNRTSFSRYSKSTQSPARIYTSDNDLHRYDESAETKLDDFLKKIPQIDSNYLNISTETEEILIHRDDLRSYFQGRGNLSKNQEAQIEAYLARQSSSDQNIFSKHLTSTSKPSKPVINDKNMKSPFHRDGNLSFTEDISTEIDVEELLPSYVNYFNHTMDSEGILFSVDELRSYLKGRANLTNSQNSQIERFLARESLLNQTVFSKYTKTTKLPTRIYTSDEDLHRDDKNEDTKLEEFLQKIPLIDSKYFNLSTNSEEIVIPIDDLRSFLRGGGNLSLAQEKKIQAYLAEQSSSDQNIFSKYLTSTKIPTTFTRSINILSQFQTEDNLSLAEHTSTDIYPEELLPSDFKYFNFTTDSEETLFTVDDFRSYLRGGGNLTNDQKTKIQAYLERQSSFNETLFWKYSKSTKQPARIYTPEDDLHRNDESDDTKLEEFLKKIPLTDSKYFNFSTDSEEILIPIDDLRSYLHGSGNLSKSQEAQIQAYLSHSSSDQNIFSNFLTSTKMPRTASIPRKNIQSQLEKQGNHSVIDDTQSEYYSEEVLPDDFEYYNRTTDSEERLFTLDNLRSYLQGRANLSRTQEAQIQAYLARQSSSNQTIFSKYAKSTKSPTRKYTSDHNILRDKDNEDLKLDDFLKNIPLTDSNYVNISLDSEEILIPVDDFRSYLQGRGNLSKSQEAQIQAYLSKQSSSDHNIFSKYLTSTKIPRTVSIPGNNIESQFERQGNHSVIAGAQPEYYSEEALPFDFEYYNRTTDSEERLFSVDDLRSYLEGRGNLSLSQEAQIQAYLARQSSSNKTVFSKYSKSTKQPARIYTSDEDLHRDNKSEDTKLEEFLHKIPLTESKYFNLSTDSEEILIPIDDLRSYLQGRANLSKSHEAQIQAYLTKQISLGNNTLPRYVNVSSIPHPSSPSFVMSNTTRFSSYRSRLSSPFPGSPVRSSTRSSKSTRLSSPKRFSEINPKLTTTPSYLTGSSPLSITLESSHQFSSMQRINAAMTSDISKQKSSTTHSELSTSAALITQHPRFASTFSSTLSPASIEQSSTTRFHQYKAKFPETHIQSSSSSYTADKTDFGLSNYRPLETTEKLQLSSTSSSSLSDRNQKDFISYRSPSDRTSTVFPHFYQEKTLSTLKQSTFDLPHPSTTILRYRSRKQKIIRWRTQEPSTTSSSTTTIIPLYQTTSIHDPKSSTSTQISIWHSEWNPLEEQQTIIIKPPLTLNDSNTFLSNDILNKIFHNISTSTNSSREKFIHFNLIDHPPSSWNLSLISNESIILDVTLPSLIYSSNSTGKTNLTFTHIEANRFSTNIIGKPVHLQIDRVYTKEFSLKMNSTDDDINSNHSVQYLSDVIIGYVKSEQFELNLTKSNKMHVHVQQVDSATAELYLDSHFCTNESSLEINFNLSKNGIIRYGNRPTIYIGPVFTRVYMLKQSCDREQPFILFFDVCQRQNPCSHGGICVSLIPDYNAASYSDTEIGHVGYRCNCPLHTFGEHCQYFKYALGYCLNGGVLFQIYDRYNKSIEKCICLIGFQGEYCEENIDNCIGIRCSNHGICEDGIQTYQCSCFDGFYGLNCERTRVKSVILQVTRRSFGIIAILLIAAIACLVVASDIHTHVTRKYQRNSLLNKIPRVTSEVLENSVLLLGFSDAPIEMNDSSIVGRRRKAGRFKQRYMKRTTRNRKPTGYRQILRRRPLITFPKTSSGRYLISSQPN